MHNPHPKVAIIVPIYNVEKYLRDCLDSIINQSYKNIEIILIDDGSDDRSCQIAKDYFLKDKRISLICKSNGGQSSARNVGIEYISEGFNFTPLLHADSIYINKANLKAEALSANNMNYLRGSQVECMGGGAQYSLYT